MKERPILMSAPMVRATLREVDPKTQTRRIAAVPASVVAFRHFEGLRWDRLLDGGVRGDTVNCPYGQPGDRLWVRETWAPQVDCGLSAERWTRGINCSGPKPIVHFAADKVSVKPWVSKWRPSIHMPRWACRIELEITGVRVERLQAISEADSIAEGIERGKGFPGWYRGPLPGDSAGLEQSGRDFKIPTAFPKLAYRALWESINGADSWAANPWVWVIDFKRVEVAHG